VIGPCPSQTNANGRFQKHFVWIGQIGKGYEDGDRY